MYLSAPEALVGVGLGQDEGLGVGVQFVDPLAHVGFEFDVAAVGGAAEFAAGQFGEPAFHHVEPRATSRSEVAYPLANHHDPVESASFLFPTVALPGALVVFGPYIGPMYARGGHRMTRLKRDGVSWLMYALQGTFGYF